jgi:hypothetical protein
MASSSRSLVPAWLGALVTAGLATVLVALYVLALRLTLDETRVDGSTTANDRDRLLAAIHGGALLLTAVLGFLTGLWLRRSALGFALLLIAVVVVGMMVVQLGSFELACRGHNDIVRHWQC